MSSTPRSIPLAVVSDGASSHEHASLEPGARQVAGDKIARSPVQFADAPTLRKPSWIRVRRGCTFHGLAFNIEGGSTAAFARINPCGYAGLQVVALSDLGGPSSLDAVKPVLLEQLGRQFGLAWRHAAAPPA